MPRRSFTEKALRAIPGLGFVIGEALDDTRDIREASLKEEDALEDLFHEVKKCKGAYIAVIDEKQNVSLQGRVYRVRRHAILLDTRKLETREDGTLIAPDGKPKPGVELKIWVPKPQESFVVLHEEGDEADEE